MTIEEQVKLNIMKSTKCSCVSQSSNGCSTLLPLLSVQAVRSDPAVEKDSCTAHHHLVACRNWHHYGDYTEDRHEEEEDDSRHKGVVEVVGSSEVMGVHNGCMERGGGENKYQ